MFLAMLRLGLGLWCLTPLSTILLVEGAGEYPEKTIDLPNVTHKLYHIYCIVYTSGFELTMLVVIGTDYIGSFVTKKYTIKNCIDCHCTDC